MSKASKINEDKIVSLHVDVIQLEKRIDKFEDFVKSLRCCETCGCLISKKHAIKSTSVIRLSTEPVLMHRETMLGIEIYDGPDKVTEVLYTPFYCKIHAPLK